MKNTESVLGVRAPAPRATLQAALLVASGLSASLLFTLTGFALAAAI
jgi:hypothetical protein